LTLIIKKGLHKLYFIMPPKKASKSSGDSGSLTSIDPTVQLQQASYVRSALEATNLALKARLDELGREQSVLKETRQELARDAKDFLEYSSKELRSRSEENASLREQLAELEVTRELQVKELRSEYAELESRSKAELEALEADLTGKINERDAKLLRAQQFLDMRDEYEAKMAELEATIERQRMQHAEEIAELERKLIVQRVEFERETEANFQAMKVKAKQEVLKEMDDETKRIFIENKRMSRELEIQTSETTSLSHERSSLADSERNLKRDLELMQTAEKQWANTSAGRDRANRDLSARCSELEALLIKERKERVAEYSTLMRAIERETEDMRLELAGLRSLQALKNRELRTIKKLAQIVLSQRTEVEQFFLDALTQVKLEVARKKAAATEAARALINQAESLESMSPVVLKGTGKPLQPPSSASTLTGTHSTTISQASLAIHVSLPVNAEAVEDGSITLPSLTAVSRRVAAGSPLPSVFGPVDSIGGQMPSLSSSASSALASETRVDISELTPEDRERVLRLLFAKINNIDSRGVTNPAPSLSSPFNLKDKGDASKDGDASDFPALYGSEGSVASEHEIDTSELAKALGAKAQERIILSEQIRQTP
jgi:hypothetical protein